MVLKKDLHPFQCRATVEIFPPTFMVIIAGLFLVDWSVLVYIDRGLKRVYVLRAKDQELEREKVNAEVSEELLKKIKLCPESEI